MFDHQLSLQNMPVERVWLEINSRINYPIMRLLIALFDDGTLDMEDSTVKFCLLLLVVLFMLV